ncbi:ATP-binding cassette domain-containing protein [Streptomyces sp. NBC_01795]|uniref:ATP-binding cassette domain-containing protein n=1 Tax=Streptomyces sp. NBC_01795 TaxID=2975943 RepID=UPI003FA3BF05
MGRHDGRRGLVRAGVRFLVRRPRVLWALAGWSVLEAAHTFALGFALARALDDGFLKARPDVGLWWLAGAGLGLLAGALGTARVYRQVAALAEPLRDELVRRVVGRALYDAVTLTGSPHTSDAGGAGGPGGAGAVSRLTHQVEIARDSFAGLVMVSRSFVFTLAGALAGLFSLAPVLLAVVLPPLAAGLAIFACTLRPLARRQRDFLVADEELAHEVGRTAGALRDVTACGAEDEVRRETEARIGAERRAADALARWGVTRALALGVGGRLPVVLLLVLTPWLLTHGVTAGALAGALTYLTQALLPALQSLVHGLGGAGARLAVVIGRLRASPPPSSPPSPPPPPDPVLPRPAHRAGTPSPALELRRLSFAYGPAAEPVLSELDLVVPAGEHLAVVGPSGAGKSTLALLAAGLLTPSGGSAWAHGRPVAPPPAAGDVRAGGLERVLIPQEAYVFTGSVRENLSCLLPGREATGRGESGRGEAGRVRNGSPLVAGAADDAALWRAAGRVGAGELVRRLGGPGGTVDPVALSAGERQLLALARACLTPAPLVVLDEATSHLDPAAEEFAERAFARREGTLVVIAHRVSSALRADRVLVLDGPRTCCGTHPDLLRRSPLYRDLTAGWAPHQRA